jgi:hypothetical protein
MSQQFVLLSPFIARYVKYYPWFGYADSADGLLIFGTKILVHGTKSFRGATNL